MRKIEPAKNYDAVSFARAMNPDFAPRLKKLFDPETDAALEAQKTGMSFFGDQSYLETENWWSPFHLTVS